MYIVFLAPETPDSKIKKQYTDICEKIKESKNTLYDGTFPPDTEAHEDHSSQLTKEIKKADALIVEATQSNFNLGRLITLALQQHKPVLMLQKEMNSTPIVIGSSRLVNVKTYKSSSEDLDDVLKDFIKVAKKQRLTYRFNLMLSRDIDIYLNDKSHESGLSKADYIRELISKDMGM
ncbi:hypothetical protein BH09PAT2_BH09PAT2_02760 [soil metagenome]